MEKVYILRYSSDGERFNIFALYEDKEEALKSLDLRRKIYDSSYSWDLKEEDWNDYKGKYDVTRKS